MSRPRTAAKRSGARPARRVSGPARDAATAAGRQTSPARPVAPRPAARGGAKAPRAPRTAAPLGGATGAATAAALAPGVAIPRQRPRPRAVPAPRRAPAARLRTLPDHHLLDSLLRSRAWIVLLGIALGGIVAMQVSLLGMNAGISEAVVKTTALQQEQEVLKSQIGTLGSGDQISREASRNGLLTPDPGGVHFLTARGGSADARIAAGALVPPSDAAKGVLAGVPSTALPEGQTTPAQQVAAATASTQSVAVPGAAPGAGANVAQPTATAAPVATATAAPTAAAAAAPTATAPTAAPQG